MLSDATLRLLTLIKKEKESCAIHMPGARQFNPDVRQMCVLFELDYFFVTHFVDSLFPK